MSPTLALSLGCPDGVGPEVALSAAARARDLGVLLVGDEAVVRAAAARLGSAPRVELAVVRSLAAARRLRPGEVGVWARSARPDARGGAAQLAWIDAATDLVARGACDALVTGPVSKAAIAASGAPGAAGFRGHTEHIAARLAAGEVTMAFAAPGVGRRRGRFATALVTTHLPLARAPRAVTALGVERASERLAELCALLGCRRPTVAVAGLNPHAGEAGLLGREELRVIGPGIEAARASLARAGVGAEFVGPMGAESAYRLAREGRFQGVVAMYHDQATIACKLTGFGEMVNVTLGLPVVRTSVDHGTAYDLAWTGRATDEGMRSALALAADLVRARPGRRRRP